MNNITFFESLDGKMLIPLDLVKYSYIKKTGHNNREKDHAVIFISDETFNTKLIVYAIKKDYDDALMPWYERFKSRLNVLKKK